MLNYVQILLYHQAASESSVQGQQQQTRLLSQDNKDNKSNKTYLKLINDMNYFNFYPNIPLMDVVLNNFMLI